MSQELVTSTDVATANVTFADQLREAQSICERLNEALLVAGYKPTNFSTDVQLLLQQAWAVASHKRNTQVTIYHIAYALVFKSPNVSTELAEYLETDVDAFAVGCILHILSLGVAASVSDKEDVVLGPAVGVTRWVGQAAILARLRGQGSELQPSDLVKVILERKLPDHEQGTFRKVARVGNARYGTVIGPKPARPIAEAQSSDIIEHLQDVEHGTDTTILLSFNKFEERYSNDIDAQNLALTSANERLAVIEEGVSRWFNAVDARASATDTRLAEIEQYVRPIDDIASKLGVIDGHVLELEKRLPRPPSGVRLSAAIVAVLALGVIAGHGLTTLQINSPDVSTLAASEK